MKTLLAYIIVLIIAAVSIQFCRANDDYEDWEDDGDSLVFQLPMKDKVVVVPAEVEEPKLIVTICDYSYLGEYSCKDLP